MKTKFIRISALLLAIIMAVGIFASCQSGGGNESTTGDLIDSIESTSPADSDKSEDATNETDEDSSNESDSATESETLEEDSTESEEVTSPSLIEGENASLIEYADRIANGVNAYFTTPDRVQYYFENQNVGVTCDLRDSKVVSSITNNKGAAYLTDTMDVFLRMTDGTIYYASESSAKASANIFKLGYYYYENRIEGQTFTDAYTFADPDGKRLNHTAVKRFNMCEGAVEDNTLKITVTNNQDPWFSFDKINFRASDFNILALTMKVDSQVSTSLGIYMNAGSRSEATSFSNDQYMGFTLEADGEYHTYYIPIYRMPDYNGKVSALRFDFMTIQGAIDAKIEISDMRLMNATINEGPEGVAMARVFHTYSDKLHQTIQIVTNREVEDVQAVGIITNIDADTVAQLVVKDRGGLHYSIEDKIAWNYVDYVGFDIKGVGIIGFILPYDGSGGNIKVTLNDGVYHIEQVKSPEGWTLVPSKLDSRNGEDLYMGHRIYTDTTHNFDKFIAEAELEINPLGEENFVIDSEASSYGEFIGYDGLRGCYILGIDGAGGFGLPYKLHQNRQYNVTFALKGDGVNDRMVYVVARFEGGGALECAALLDGKQMMLPVPLEVGKNFAEEGNGNLFNRGDAYYSETILPLIADKDTDSTYSIVNVYYNWGKYPLKQISFIQYYAPYYHLSTGVHESNCIIPYYFPNTSGTHEMLPDHRPMSGPFLEPDPQHTYCGVHTFLQYTDADGNYSATENYKDAIGSYGPIYADVTMDFISDDGKIKVTYNHMEFPQTDENRAYYEMKYEVLEDISFKDFARDFSFYSVTSLDPTGLYSKVGYLDTDNQSQVAVSANQGESFSYVLGDNCPYFSFFDMENCGDKERGYNNLSFLIYNASFTIGGESADPNFIVVNDFAKLSLSLDLGEVTLKAGDAITIYAIIMPWQYYDVYDELEPDKNVRRVRENTLLDPLTLTAGDNCEKIESVFLPKAKTTDGKSATFTLSGGHNNVAVRIYGFDKLTVPVVEELVDGEWVTIDLSSFSTPDNFGYGYFYDGYGVYYDGDGTYSYAFITTMTNGAERTFRITASEDFDGWPEIVKEPDPMNFWLDPQKLNAAFVTAATRFGSISMLSEDGVNFVRVVRNGTTKEATLPLFENAEGALAGRYLVVKYRVPQGADAKINTLQFYTSTENVMYDADGNILIVGQDFNASAPTLSDGNWHVIVIDLSSYTNRTNCFKQDEDGNYYIQYLRYDTFNPEYAADAIVDLAYVGMHDSLEEILEYNKEDMPTVALFTNNELEYVSTKNNEALNLHFDAAELDAIIERYKNRFHSVTLSEDRSYLTLAGSVGGEAIIEIFRGNKKETGQYFVLKYRIPESGSAPFGYWQFYTNTDNAAASGANNYYCEGVGTMVIADGEWHVLVVDLAARGLETFAEVDGKYTAKYFRFDFFNSQFDESVYYDVEYMAFSNSLEDILEYNNDMEFITLNTSKTDSVKIDPKTGEELTK